MATSNFGENAEGRTATGETTRGLGLEVQTVVGDAFYVWDEDRRYALEWGAELQDAAQRTYRTHPSSRRNGRAWPA
jgi:hypothetical protein